MTSNITILKKLKPNDLISYKNESFKRVSPWGRFIRILRSIFCQNGFKDCKSALITSEMVKWFNKQSFTKSDASLIRKNITQYAEKNKTTSYLVFKKVVPVQRKITTVAELVDGSAILKKEKLPPSKKTVDWEEILNSATISDEELMELLKSSSVSNLSPEGAVQLYVRLMGFDVQFYLNDRQRGAIARYLIRTISTQPPIIEVASWSTIVEYLKNPKESIDDYFFRKIVDKDVHGIKKMQAKAIISFLKPHSIDYSNEFAEKVKANFANQLGEE